MPCAPGSQTHQPATPFTGMQSGTAALRHEVTEARGSKRFTLGMQMHKNTKNPFLFSLIILRGGKNKVKKSIYIQIQNTPVLVFGGKIEPRH